MAHVALLTGGSLRRFPSFISAFISDVHGFLLAHPGTFGTGPVIEGESTRAINLKHRLSNQHGVREHYGLTRRSLGRHVRPSRAGQQM